MHRTPRSAEELSPRAGYILDSIVRAHIDTGEPVASQGLAKLPRHSLSAASIRNVMAELAERGYLSQPHPSAGRTPTAKAYQRHVQAIGPGRMAPAELNRIRGELSQHNTLEGRVGVTSRMLTDLTRGVGIAAAIPTGNQILDKVELVSLGGARVLMVVVTRDQMIRDQVVSLDEAVTATDLTAIRNFFNEHYSGWVVSDVRADLRQRLERESTAYRLMLQRLVALYDRCLEAAGLAPELHLGGASNLLSFEFGLTRERLREMFRTLEEKKRIVQLLERFLEPPLGEVTFQIGLGDEDPNLESLSLIGVSVRMPGGLTSRFAVIGPMRMDYARAVSAVRYVSRAFQSIDGPMAS
jgi:heat-inducible transcriptional repressor